MQYVADSGEVQATRPRVQVDFRACRPPSVALRLDAVTFLDGQDLRCWRLIRIANALQTAGGSTVFLPVCLPVQVLSRLSATSCGFHLTAGPAQRPSIRAVLVSPVWTTTGGRGLDYIRPLAPPRPLRH